MAVAVDGPKAVLLRDDDNVAVAARPIPKGFALERGRAGRSRSANRSALGHKVALAISPWASRCASTARSSGSPRSRSPPGRWVHVHNVKADLFERDYAYASEQPRCPPLIEGRTFQATSGPTAGWARGTMSRSSAR